MYYQGKNPNRTDARDMTRSLSRCTTCHPDKPYHLGCLGAKIRDEQSQSRSRLISAEWFQDLPKQLPKVQTAHASGMERKRTQSNSAKFSQRDIR
jgi:hypothetical protein